MGQSTPGCSLLLAPPYLKLVTKPQSHLTRQTQKPKGRLSKIRDWRWGREREFVRSERVKESANSPSPPLDSRPSLRPASAYSPIIATTLRPQLRPQKVRSQVPSACALRHPARRRTANPLPPPTSRSRRRRRCLQYTGSARPAPPHARVGPRNPSAAGAASQVSDAGITWIPAFGLTPPVDLQAPQT